MKTEYELLIEVFKDATQDNFWKSIDDLAKTIKVSKTELLGIVNEHDDVFVQLSDPKNKKDYVTTLEKYRQFEKLSNKLLGAFKNRLR